MNERAGAVLNNIRDAAEALKELRPAYAEIIDYYEQVSIEQESAKRAVKIDALDSLLDSPRPTPEQSSLIGMSEFVVDRPTALHLLSKICSITQAAGLGASPSAGRLKAAIGDDHLDFSGLSRAFLDQDGPAIHQLGSTLAIDQGFLLHATYHSLKPSFEMCAERLSVYLSEDCHRDKGCCPICGGHPTLSLLEKEGKRYLFCGVCWHRWRIKRGFCPVCANENFDTLQYFFSDDEEEYRVELCEKCKSYLKCIDSRNTARMSYPPLELAATAHLDLRAQAQGYRSSSEFVF